ncbi:MAG: endopeptidase La [candidate division Zixibacteria bacterium]|nr:endopeptidase La [candidate division Zixibacteria bacterium]
MKLKHNSEEIDVKSRLPVIPLRDVVVFPHMIYPLLVGRKFTVQALQEAMILDKQVLLVAQRSPGTDNPKPGDLYSFGVVARVLQVMKLPNGSLKVLVEGLFRAELLAVSRTEGFLSAKIKLYPPETKVANREIEALSRSVAEQFTEYVRMNRRIPDEVLVSLASIDQYHQLADTIAAHLLHKIDIKQRILEAVTVRDQFAVLADILKEEIEILKIEMKIEGSVRESMSRGQREMYLQQQLKAIKDELGQSDESIGEVDDLLTKIESGDFPEKAKAKAEEELKKLSKMHPYSAESGVVRSYLEWLICLPWKVNTQDRTDFASVKSILDGDHFGLDKAKRRILEHLAVIRLAGRVKGPILCLVGPPGVGKTSIGRSIAHALGRKFVRMSLGGIHDEAEIRGHRRTYIGALPGRIIQSLKKAESSNPLFLLDEVDKIGRDFRGDPAAALLEVLDPEQNSTFYDNYLELDYDLSNILFITTANSTAGIPEPLRDRMEIIRLPGYLDFEKAAIARDFLLPKLVSEFGLDPSLVQLSSEAIYEVINHYTRESGVRELERQLSSMLRKIAVELAEGKKLRKVVISKTKAQKFLGARKYIDTNIKPIPTIGYAVGLAWTELGGEVLPVEVVPMRGKAKLTLTGSLGDVMRESGTAAMSYIRNHAKELGLSHDFFETLELHVHIPEGAVPKDGPSAGVTLLTAMLSSLTNIPVRTDIAMTGEITLSGDVLPIGGLNEKLLAAKRIGINEIIVPERNRKDVVEIQPELLEGLKLHFVSSVKEVIKLSLVRTPYQTAKSKVEGSDIARRI